MEVETQYQDIKIKDKLGEIGHFFYKNILVMLDNGIGVMRPDDGASRLNVHALNKFAIDNFGWKGKIVAANAAPAGCIFELFRWSEAIFRIRNGDNAQNKLIISDLVQNQIEKGLRRQHALSINQRILKRRLISGFQLPMKPKKEPKQTKTKESKTKQSKTKESKTKESKTKEPKTKKQKKEIKPKKIKQLKTNSFFDDDHQGSIFDEELDREFDDMIPFPKSLLLSTTTN